VLGFGFMVSGCGLLEALVLLLINFTVVCWFMRVRFGWSVSLVF